MKIKILGQEVEVTKDNVWEIQDELNLSLTKIRKFTHNFAVCSRCDSTFGQFDEGSQWTKEGVLCPDCHKTYTIKEYDDGSVGVVNTVTGEDVGAGGMVWL